MSLLAPSAASRSSGGFCRGCGRPKRAVGSLLGRLATPARFLVCLWALNTWQSLSARLRQCFLHLVELALTSTNTIQGHAQYIVIQQRAWLTWLDNK